MQKTYTANTTFTKPSRLHEAISVLLFLIVGALCFSAQPTNPAYADDVSIDDAPQISITAPVTINAVLEPNQGTITVPDITIQNNSSCSIILDEANMSFEDGTDGTWTLMGGGQRLTDLTKSLPKSTLNEEISKKQDYTLNVKTDFSGVAAGKMVNKTLGSFMWTFSPKIESFAVFSADDGSLNFYKRAGKPEVGETWRGKNVNAVYSNIESLRMSDFTSQPWRDIKTSVKEISFLDKNITPISMACWFQGFSNTININVANLDTSKNVSISGLFYGCASLQTITGLSDWDTTNLIAANSAFWGCENISTLDFSNWDCTNLATATKLFDMCNKLEKVTIGTNWKWMETGYLPSQNTDNIPLADGRWYNIDTGDSYAPSDVPSGKATTYVAIPLAYGTLFADGSLIFTRGTSVDDLIATHGNITGGPWYLDEERGKYASWNDYITNNDNRYPWCRNGNGTQIKSVSFRDKISPKNANWLLAQISAKTIDVTNLDLSNCTMAERLFSGDGSLTTLIGGETLDTSKLEYVCAMFDGVSLHDFSFLENWDVSSAKNLLWLFYNCYYATSINLSNWNLESFDQASHAICESADQSFSNMYFISSTNNYPARLLTVSFGENSAKIAPYLLYNTSKMEAGGDGKWYSSSTGASYAYTDIPTDKSDTYYARKPIMLSFDTQGGPNIASLRIMPNKTYGDLPTPQRDGYTFLGWYTSATDGTEVTSDMIAGSSDVTLYAHWKAHTLTVIFHNDGATELYRKANWSYDTTEPEDITGIDVLWTLSYKYDEKFNGGYGLVDVNRLVKHGYHSRNKNTNTEAWRIGSKDSSHIVGDENRDGTTADMATYLGCLDELNNGDVTLDAYPILDANTYTIKLDPNATQNGIGTMNTIAMTYDQPAILPECTFSNTNSDQSSVRFAGWNTKADGSGESYSDKQSVMNLTETNNGTITLYAQWEFLQTFDMKYDNSVMDNIYDYVSPSDSSADSIIASESPQLKIWCKPGTTVNNDILTNSMTSDEKADWNKKWAYSESLTTDASSTKYAIQIDRQKYYLDLNSYLDQQEKLDMKGIGTANIWVNDVQKTTEGSYTTPGNFYDYYTTHKYGSSYHIVLTNIEDEYELISDSDLSGTITGTTWAVFRFKTRPLTAFAVYSADDNSLDFYKRLNVPSVGDTLEGRIVTSVYTGFETERYTWVVVDGTTSDMGGDVTAPWYEYHDDVVSINFIDEGIKPKSMAFWFQHFTNANSVNGINKIDGSLLYTMQHTFYHMKKLPTVDLNGLDTSHVTSFDAMFSSCSNLQSIDFSQNDLSSMRSIGWLFTGCCNLISVSGLGSRNGSAIMHPIHLAAMFNACVSLEKIDISGIATDKITADTTYGFKNLFTDCRKMSSITIGNQFNLAGDGSITSKEFLGTFPTPSSEDIVGADGKWYALSTGIAYDPDSIPANTAETYVAVKENDNSIN